MANQNAIELWNTAQCQHLGVTPRSPEKENSMIQRTGRSPKKRFPAPRPNSSERKRHLALGRLRQLLVENQAGLHRCLQEVADTLGSDPRERQTTRAAVTGILRKKKLPVREIKALVDTFLRRATAVATPRSGPDAAKCGGTEIRFDDGGDSAEAPFRMTSRGVERLIEDPHGNQRWRWVCSPLEVRALSRSSQGEDWGRVLQWVDPDGREHVRAIPASTLAADATLRGVLLDGGVLLPASPAASRDLREYLCMTRPDARVRCVREAGWHSGVYVLGNATFPHDAAATGEQIILQSTHGIELPLHEAGTLSQWQEQIARLCVGNSRLAFSLSMAFAPPLLDLIGAEGGGAHLFGRSSTGKTTAQRVAGSAWGGGSEHGWLHTWRATANGLESIAAAHRDGLLALDELGEASGAEVGDTVYMLAGGQAKARARGDGTGQPSLTWRLLWLSSGEITLHSKMREAGHTARAGQHVRLIEIPADAGAGYGIYEQLHEFTSGAALTDHLVGASRQFYGTAIREFLAQVAARRESIARQAPAVRRQWVGQNVPAGADGQVQRVADRCALIAAAGELARNLGILPWPSGESFRAASVCFKAWLAHRGGTGPAELKAGIEQVRAFLRDHGTTRFSTSGTSVVHDHAGFVRFSDRDLRGASHLGVTTHPSQPTTVAEFLIEPTVWRDEVCRGYDSKYVAEALANDGRLRRDKWDEKTQARRRVPGVSGIRRYYVITPSILADAEGDQRATLVSRG